MSQEAEPNGTIAGANPLAFATPIKGQLATNTDLDFYKITATAAGALSLVFDAPANSSLDYFQIGLFSSTGVQLALFTTGSDKTFQTAVQAAGDYYIGIGSGSFFDSNQYNLTANFTAGSTAGSSSADSTEGSGSGSAGPSAGSTDSTDTREGSTAGSREGSTVSPAAG